MSGYKFVKSKVRFGLYMISILTLCIVAILSASTIAEVGDTTSNAKSKAIENQANIAVTVACVSIGDSDHPPIAVLSFANLGNAPLYIRATENLNLVLMDKKGARVGGQFLKSPPPPPLHYVVTKDGERKLMHPVWKLEPGKGIVRVIPNILDGYQTLPPPGQYNVVVPLKDIQAFSEEQIIQRSNTNEKLWIEAGKRGTRIPVVTNISTIDVAEL